METNVTLFQKMCDELGYTYEHALPASPEQYGNLADADGPEDQKIRCISYTDIIRFAAEDKIATYEGALWLLKKSPPDGVIWGQRGVPNEHSRYGKHVLPLLTGLGAAAPSPINEIQHFFDCEERASFSFGGITELYDVLKMHADGIQIKYSLEIYYS